VCFWEFSGYEPYFVAYDEFVGDPNSVYVIVTSMKDSPEERRRQFQFWLDYLRCHISFVEPIGTCRLVRRILHERDPLSK